MTDYIEEFDWSDSYVHQLIQLHCHCSPHIVIWSYQYYQLQFKQKLNFIDLICQTTNFRLINDVAHNNDSIMFYSLIGGQWIALMVSESYITVLG